MPHTKQVRGVIEGVGGRLNNDQRFRRRDTKQFISALACQGNAS